MQTDLLFAVAHSLIPARRRYFIAHSYQDVGVVAAVNASLPRWIDLVVFPPTQLPVDQVVSSPILETIRTCDGLVFPDTPASAASFWVPMERDYALRQGKPVFEFMPGRKRFRRWRAKVLSPAIYTANATKDTDIVRRVVDLMDQRFISVTTGIRPADTVDFEKTAVEQLRDLLKSDGYVVLFWSERARDNRYVSAELTMALEEFPRQILVAKLDDTPLPQNLLAPLIPQRVVDLRHCADVSSVQRTDDLIVRLYWLVTTTSVRESSG